MLLSALSPEISASDGALVGTVARFTEIDKDQPWFDAESLGRAEENILENIVIPDRLKPNYTPFSFRFFPNNHTLIFETNNRDGAISPRLMLHFFDMLMNDRRLSSEFGYASVNLITRKQEIDEMLSTENLKHIKISIQRPNPDDMDYEEEVERRMLATNTAKITYQADAVPGSALAPDEEMKKMARLAAKDGEVEIRATRGRKLTRKSTVDHPAVDEFTYDPDSLTEGQSLIRAAQRFISNIIGT